jgi:hypothetical protein
MRYTLSLEKRGAQRLFHSGDLHSQGRLGHSQAICGPAKAASIRYRLKITYLPKAQLLRLNHISHSRGAETIKTGGSHRKKDSIAEQNSDTTII